MPLKTGKSWLVVMIVCLLGACATVPTPMTPPTTSQALPPPSAGPGATSPEASLPKRIWERLKKPQPPGETAAPALEEAETPVDKRYELTGEDARELERGAASWYGPRFHGRLTASGERYDKYALTAAHKTLPFGTVVRVRSLRLGREVDVRINDRGPFAAGRVIDVSQAAAEALGLTAEGVAEVTLNVTDATLEAVQSLVPAKPTAGSRHSGKSRAKSKGNAKTGRRPAPARRP